MKRRAFVAVALVTALTARAAGETYHIKSPSTLRTEKGSELNLPPGYFLDERTWQERDLELKEAQEQRVRLKAENESLRKSATEYPWLATCVVGAFGVLVGVVYMTTK